MRPNETKTSPKGILKNGARRRPSSDASDTPIYPDRILRGSKRIRKLVNISDDSSQRHPSSSDATSSTSAHKSDNFTRSSSKVQVGQSNPKLKSKNILRRSFRREPDASDGKDYGERLSCIQPLYIAAVQRSLSSLRRFCDRPVVQSHRQENSDSELYASVKCKNNRTRQSVDPEKKSVAAVSKRASMKETRAMKPANYDEFIEELKKVQRGLALEKKSQESNAIDCESETHGNEEEYKIISQFERNISLDAFSLGIDPKKSVSVKSPPKKPKRKFLQQNEEETLKDEIQKKSQGNDAKKIFQRFNDAEDCGEWLTVADSIDGSNFMNSASENGCQFTDATSVDVLIEQFKKSCDEVNASAFNDENFLNDFYKEKDLRPGTGDVNHKRSKFSNKKLDMTGVSSSEDSKSKTAENYDIAFGNVLGKRSIGDGGNSTSSEMNSSEASPTGRNLDRSSPQTEATETTVQSSSSNVSGKMRQTNKTVNENFRRKEFNSSGSTSKCSNCHTVVPAPKDGPSKDEVHLDYFDETSEIHSVLDELDSRLKHESESLGITSGDESLYSSVDTRGSNNQLNQVLKQDFRPSNPENKDLAKTRETSIATHETNQKNSEKSVPSTSRNEASLCSVKQSHQIKRHLGASPALPSGTKLDVTSPSKSSPSPAKKAVAFRSKPLRRKRSLSSHKGRRNVSSSSSSDDDEIYDKSSNSLKLVRSLEDLMRYKNIRMVY